MAIDKLIPQYLNLDDDERFLKSNEMKYAQNVRISVEKDGDGGVIKNIKGNVAIAAESSSHAIPAAGDNLIIGVCSSESAKCIYYFLYNSLGSHGIYRYDLEKNTYRRVYQDSVLNFAKESFVKSDLVVNQYGEHLLYFTDGRNEPRKINATKVLLGISGLNNPIDNDGKLTAINACKRPPQTPATFEFKTNKSLSVNRLKDSVWQFAYQYQYEDGEVSAVSQYSKLAVSPSHIAANNVERGIFFNGDNEIEVSVSCGASTVKKIFVLARKNNEGAFYKIDEVDNNPGASTVKSVFRNDKTYSIIPDQEALKPFDAVPRTAQTQVVSNNRLFYGNYVDGFDNIKPSAYTYPVYYPEQQASDMSFSIPQLNNGDTHMELCNWLWFTYTGEASTDDGAYYPQTEDPDTYWTDETEFTCYGTGSGTTKFDIDFTSVSEQDLVGDVTVYLDISLFADEICISAKPLDETSNGVADHRFEVDVTVRHEDFAADEYTGTVSVCSPESDTSYSDIAYVHANNGRSGNIRNLSIVGGNNLEVAISVSALDIVSNGGGVTGLVNVVAQKLNDPNVVGALTVVVESALPSFFVDSSNTSNILNNTTLANLNHIEMWFAGNLDFAIEAYPLIAGNEAKVGVIYKMVNVELTATRARAFRTYSNAFHPDPIDGIEAAAAWWYQIFSIGDGVQTGDYAVGGAKVYTGEDVECVISTETVSQVSGSLSLKDSYDGSDTLVFHAMKNTKFAGYASVLPTEVVKTFKSGANHNFGIVYFDRNNRSSGVQPIGSIGVASPASNKRGGNRGRAEIDLRVYHEPPWWATKWAPVYSKNTTYDYYLQTSVAEALLPDSKSVLDILSPAIVSEDTANAQRSNILSPGENLRSTLFISMRTLEGKSTSYKEAKGGLVDYSFVDGDVLRVLSYQPRSGKRKAVSHEFIITGYHYFNDDDKNPLEVLDPTTAVDADTDDKAKTANAYRRTGWFLSVRDSNIPGFSREDILVSEDYWSQGCIVEIYRPKKPAEQELYYEIGNIYDIVTTDEGYRTHGGDRPLSIASTNLFITPIDRYKFKSTKRFYVGDKIVTTATTYLPSGYAFITSIKALDNGAYMYNIHESNPFSAAATGVSLGVKIADTSASSPTSPNSVYAGVVTMNSGDAYIRPREMMFPKRQSYTPTNSEYTFQYHKRKVAETDFLKYNIEDASVSDFFYSPACDVGRPHIETPDQRSLSRYSSVTYSSPFSSDSSRLMLSTFNPNEFPFKDYSMDGGAVMHMHDANESLLVLQEKKASLTPIERNLIQTTNDGMLVTSTNVMGTSQYFAGNFGISRNPESFAARAGKMFFTDVENAKVIEINGKGMSFVSDNKMESYFDELYSQAASLKGIPKVVCGISPDNNEYITTIQNIDVEDVVIAGSVVATIQDSLATSVNADGRVDIVFADENMLTWDKDCYRYQLTDLTFDPKWSEVGKGLLNLDALLEKGAAAISSEFIGNTGEVTIDVVGTRGTNTYRGTCQISLSDRSVDLGDYIMNCGSGTAQTIGIQQNLTAFQYATVGYKYDSEVWQSFYTYIPDMYTNIHNKMFTFKEGAMYEHGVNDTRCNFYGTQYGFEFEVISRQNPSMIKVYNAVSLEGDFKGTPVLTFKNAHQTATYGTAANHPYEDREYIKYAPMPKSSSTAVDMSDRHAVYVGQITNVAGNVITVSNPLSKLPIKVGQLSTTPNTTTPWTTEAVFGTRTGSNQITCVGDISGLTVGDHVTMGVPSVISGDDIRDYYLNVNTKILNTDAGAAARNEVYAVNLEFTPSPYHHESQPQQTNQQ